MFLQIVTVLYLALGATGTPTNLKIVNGTDAKEGEFPFIVSIRIADSHNCGGTILDERHILTAAHCVSGLKTSYFSVQYGVTEITSGAKAANVIRNITKVMVNHNYVAGNGYKNDVAIIQLGSPMTFSKTVQPVKLAPPFNRTPEWASAELAGWGIPYSGGWTMTHLQKVTITVFSDDECEKIHALTGPTDRNFHICAGIPGGGKGQCSGDSGGPLLVNGTQVGIVSWSVKPCAREGYPGVFTKVSTQILWIHKHLIQN